MSVSKITKKKDEDESSRKASQLPKPLGYKLLIALPEPEEKTEGGIIKSAKSLQEETTGSITGISFWSLLQEGRLDFNALLFWHSIYCTWSRVPINQR